MGSVPTQETVHIDAAMTAVSVRYNKNEYVAEQAFPRVPVKKQSDKYYVHDKEHLRDDLDDRRRPGDSPREVRWSLSDDTYACECHSRTGILPDEIRSNSDPAVQSEMTTTQLATEKVLLRQEINARALLQDFTTTFDATNSEDEVGAKWESTGNADWIQIISEVKPVIHKASTVRPNLVIMNNEVIEKIKHSSAVIARFKYVLGDTSRGPGPLIKTDDIGALIGMRVVVADAILNTGAFGEFTGTYLLGNHCWVLHATPTPGLNVVTFGYTFVWSALAGGQQGQIVERERLGGGRKSTAFYVHKYYDFKVVDRLAAYCFKNVI